VFDGITGVYLSPPIHNPRPAGSDNFGASLSSFGNNIVVGVPGDDENGGGSGSIYVIDGNTKSELFYIPNPSAGGGAGDDFGTSVGAAGNYVVIGSPDDDDTGSNDGAIYIYDGTTGTQKAYLPNPNPSLSTTADMGESVAINAVGIAVAGAEDSESAFVFSFDGTSATFIKEIVNPDVGESADFAASVGMLNDDVIIGVPFDDVVFHFGSVALYSSDPPPNTAPVAVNDSDVATNNTPVVIDVLNNDSDVDGHTLTVDTVNVSGTQGTVINNGADVTFTANLNFDGVTTFSYKATDGNGGLSNTGIVSVTVTDDIAPVILLTGDNPQTISLGAGYVELGYTTDDGSIVSVNDLAFVDAVGSYSIFYDSVDVNGNVGTTVTRTVNVVDIIPPVITIPANQTFEATNVLTPLDPTDYGVATATDNVDSSPVITNNATATFTLGDTIILWTATDSSSNSANNTQIITVQDTTDPVLVILGDNPQLIEIGGTYVESDATATDNIDGIITGDIVIDSAAVDVNTVGSYPVTYNVADSSGNSPITEFRNVIIQDTTPPVIALTGANPQIIEFSSGYVELGATTDDGSPVTIDTTDFVDAVGTYSILYDSVDSSGNNAIQKIRIVNVVPAIPDPIDTLDATTVSNDTIQLDWITPNDNEFPIIAYLIERQLSSESSYILVAHNTTTVSIPAADIGSAFTFNLETDVGIASIPTTNIDGSFRFTATDSIMTSFDDTGLIPDTQYTYSIQSINSQGISLSSNIVMESTLP